jgi:Na+/melibiose symporter-like transporter
MRIGYILIPVGSLLAALVIFKFFPINPVKAAEIRKELEVRRGQV